MAECELRQRKKEDDGEINLQEDKEEIKSVEQDKVHSENKPEPVRFIDVLCGKISLFFLLLLFDYGRKDVVKFMLCS